MITYKYKLYRTEKTKHLDKMLLEACFVWNHALALQKRYYRLFKKYIPLGVMQRHQAKRVKRNLLGAQTVQEIIERLDITYKRFFEHLATRPPKFRKAKDFASIAYKQNGFSLCGNEIVISKIHKSYKFSKNRNYEGNIKRVVLKRNRLGEYFILIVTDAKPQSYGKTLKGASVGIDFGLKKYLTLSDGTSYDNPQLLKESLFELRRRSRNLSKSKKDSNNHERKRKDLDRLMNDICNRRSDFQWKLAHELCRKYDSIFIEDLNLEGMNRRWGRKIHDLAHANFVQKLEYIATKYGVVVHKIDRFYPSSKTCECGYINKELKLSDRQWVCPECGTVNDRDLLAANNILRRGIYELESDSKSSKRTAKRLSRLHPRIQRL